MAKGVLTGKLVGGETIVGDIRRYGETIRARLKVEVERSGRELVQAARAKAPRRTGSLAASITAEGMETEKRLAVKVGSPLFYSRFLESGWTPNPTHKFTSVHDVFGPYGPSVLSLRGGNWKRNPRNAKGWAAAMANGGKRKVYARPFLKPALAAMRSTIRERLLAAVNG